MRGKRPKLAWKSVIKPAGEVKDPSLRSITWLAAQLRALRSYLMSDGAVLPPAGRGVVLDVVSVPVEVAVQADSDWRQVFQASAGLAARCLDPSRPHVSSQRGFDFRSGQPPSQ
eukprot:9188181-Pyramimonas_sp.AAC.1